MVREGAPQLGPLVEVLLVLLAFLALNASWAPQSQLSVKQAGSDCDNPDPRDMPVAVLLRVAQLEVTDDGVTRALIDYHRDARGRLQVGALSTQLAALKQLHPEVNAIALYAEDEVPYDDLIRVVDTVKPSFSTVVISPATGS